MYKMMQKTYYITHFLDEIKKKSQIHVPIFDISYLMDTTVLNIGLQMLNSVFGKEICKLDFLNLEKIGQQMFIGKNLVKN